MNHQMDIEVENSLMRKNNRRKKQSSWLKLDKSKVILGAIIGVPLFIFFICVLVSSMHFVNEGHIAVYFKYGALKHTIGLPGLNWKTPFVMSHQIVKIRPTSDLLPDFSAVTKDSIPITLMGDHIVK